MLDSFCKRKEIKRNKKNKKHNSELKIRKVSVIIYRRQNVS
jgi:hypothetical protein